MYKKLLFSITLSFLTLGLSGQNLLRDDMLPDGIGGIVDWNLPRAGTKVERLAETGPAGMPVLRFSKNSGTSCSHVGFTLIKDEIYSFSVKVRTCGLTEKTNARILFRDTRRLKKGVEIAVPLDTDGNWQTLTWEGKCPDSLDGLYDICFAYTGHIPEGAYWDITEPVFVPVSEAAVAAKPKRSTSTAYIGRITPVAPELYMMDASDLKVDFYYPEELERMPEAYFLRVYAGDKKAEAEFDQRHRAIVSLGQVPQGFFILRAELVGKESGKVLKTNEYRARAIVFPSNPTEGRRLNNFVTELYSEKLANGAHGFVLARNSYIYLCTDKQYKGVSICLDGKEVLSGSKEGLPETMRYIPMGNHVITVSGVKGASAKGTITLRLVKNIGSAPVGFSVTSSPRFMEYRFGPSFFSRLNMYDGFNQFTLGEKNRENPESVKLQKFLEDRGVRTLYSMGMVTGTNPCRYKLDEYKAKAENNVPFSMNLPCIFQENKIDGDYRTKYNASEVWWGINVGGKKMGVYIEDGNHCRFNRPEIDTPELAGYSNTGVGENAILEEAYYQCYPTEEGISKKLDFIRRQAIDRKAEVPTSMAHTIYVFNGWMRLGSWTRWTYPQTDYKPFYAKILQMMATDPAFSEIGGVTFSTPSCDEDLFRFTYDAFRYYCIEGKTGDFAEICKMPLINRTVVNGDFTEGFDGWTKNVVTEGGVKLKKLEGLGNGPQRRIVDRTPGFAKYNNKNQGDDFALLKDGGNSLSQVVTGLTKGQYYQLVFSSFDYNQLVTKKKKVTPRKSGIKVELSGKVLEYPEMEQVYARTTTKSKLKGTVFTHRIVFLAKSDKVEIKFTNNGSKHSWGFNYVGVRPYYVKNKAEFNTLLNLYIESDNQR